MVVMTTKHGDNKMRKHEIEKIKALGEAIADGCPQTIVDCMTVVNNMLPQIGESAVKFVCPECQDTRLECIEHGNYNSEVLNIDEEGDFDFGDIDGGGMVERFQCIGCGYNLTQDPKDPQSFSLTEHEEVVEWCKENCKQE